MKAPFQDVGSQTRDCNYWLRRGEEEQREGERESEEIAAFACKAERAREKERKERKKCTKRVGRRKQGFRKASPTERQKLKLKRTENTHTQQNC